MFFRYGKKYLGPFGAKLKCEYCGRILKNQLCEYIEDNTFSAAWEKMALERTNVYFCDGHLIKYFKKLNKEFLLSKI